MSTNGVYLYELGSILFCKFKGYGIIAQYVYTIFSFRMF